GHPVNLFQRRHRPSFARLSPTGHPPEPTPEDYHAVVKNTERGDVLNVEVEATLQQRQFTLKQLAHRYDPRLRALTTYADVSVYLPTFSPPISTNSNNTWSSMPLVPSTPLPEDTSVTLARAWNPSSQTPLPGSGFSCNHYMDSEHLATDICIGVRVAGTKPILKDPGWKAGDWEGKPGLWSKADNKGDGYAYVRMGCDLCQILECYISPIPPFKKGERVIGIDGTDRAHYCREYYVIDYDSVEQTCLLRLPGDLKDKAK
ncbi:hypothetical protein H0H92_008558, partial [Tricholoma furcatifolium]